MKRILISFFAIMLIGCVGPQKTADINDVSAESKANVIVVHTNMESDKAFKKVGNMLLYWGHTFRHVSKNFNSFSTEFTSFTNKPTDELYVRFGVNIKNESKANIMIRGWYTTSGTKDTKFGHQISKIGVNGSKRRTAWSAMFQLAKSLGDSLSYQVE